MKYIKKPVIIDAIQVSANNFDRICDFMGCTPEHVLNPVFCVDDNGDSLDPYIGIVIETLEGRMTANLGDMIIKGVKGEFYLCKPDIFAAIYERAPTDYKDRMRCEYVELKKRFDKLDKFIDPDNQIYKNLDGEQQALLQQQYDAMRAYLYALGERCKIEGIAL